MTSYNELSFQPFNCIQLISLAMCLQKYGIHEGKGIKENNLKITSMGWSECVICFLFFLLLFTFGLGYRKRMEYKSYSGKHFNPKIINYVL